MNPDTKNYALGKGIPSLGLIKDDGSFNPHRHLGNAHELNMSVDIETLEHFSSMAGTKKKDDEFTLQVTPKIAWNLDEISPENVELATQGERTEITQVAATAESSAFTAQKGCFFNLGKRDVSNVVLQMMPRQLRNLTVLMRSFRRSRDLQSLQ